MNDTLDNRYFEWLYGQIAAVRNRNPARSYWSLARQLYSREFVWLVPNDDNRLEDGKELRLEFMDEQGSDGIDPDWMDLGCSMLEMLIALARIAAFEADHRSAREWFWVFMGNLGLDEYTDLNYQVFAEREIDSVLDQVIFRTYAPNGHGGLFPLRNATQDQRKVELWYQMSAYLLEVAPL